MLRESRSRLDSYAAFENLSREHGFESLRVEGTVPEELAGTLYRVGPSIFDSFGQRYGHWFDGDGAVSAVRFEGGKASGAVRLVQSLGLQEEREAVRRLFAGYGTPMPGGFLARIRQRTKNLANISVFGWDGRLFALFEAGRPTEIDPDDLQTLGETDLGGVLGPSFSAHPHRIASRRATYNFGVRYGKDTLLDIYVLPDGGPARRLTTLPLSGPTMIHDFIATDRHLIFLAPPLRLRILRQLLGKGSYGENLAWKPELGTEVLVVPIDAPEKVIRFQAEPFYQWHFTNAFERDGSIVLDMVRYPDFTTTNEWLGRAPHGGSGLEANGSYHRATIDPARRSLRSEEVLGVSCEFPRIAPQKVGQEHGVVWMAAHSGDKRQMFDALLKLDVETGKADIVALPAGQYPSEPVFVPRRGGSAEDDGWVLTLVYDAPSHTSHVAIFDGRRPERGSIAAAYFDHHLPFTFHGGFLPSRNPSRSG